MARWPAAREAETTQTTSRRRRRLLLLFVAVAAGIFVPAATASAHSQLEETTPRQGEVLASAPTEIRLRFNEDVGIGAQAIRVLDSRGDAVEVGSAEHPDGDAKVVRASLPELGDGQYVVGWKASSADTHPVSGAFVFSVGTAAPSGSVRGLLQSVLDQEGGSRVVAVSFVVVRMIAFLVTAVLIGGAALSLFGMRVVGGRATMLRAPYRWSVWAGLVTSVIGFLLQGPYSNGASLSSAFSPTTWSDAVGITGGWLWLVRAGLFGLALVILGRIRSSGEPPEVGRIEIVGSSVIAVGLCAAIAGSGHSIAGPWPAGAFALDVVHLLSMGVWIGGLVIVVSALWGRDRQDHDQLRPLVDRFSLLALVGVALIVATGVAQSIRQLGEFNQLTSTNYGKLLIVKVILVGLMVSLGWFGRIVLRGVEGGAALPHLRRSVLAEAVLAVAVLGVTSVLSTTVPARDQIAREFNRTIVDDKQFVALTVSPARVGANEMHVTVTPTAAQTTISEIKVTISLPAADLGPIEIPTQNLTANHVTTSDAQFPTPGTWTVTVAVRYGEFDSQTTTAEVLIR